MFGHSVVVCATSCTWRKWEQTYYYLLLLCNAHALLIADFLSESMIDINWLGWLCTLSRTVEKLAQARDRKRDELDCGDEWS